MEDKYIRLLVDRCLNFSNTKSLFISYDKVNKSFVDKLVSYVKDKGIEDIYLDEEDIYLLHDKLINLSLSEIGDDSYFDKSIWDEYAKKNSCFLMLETEFPGVMDDVSADKIALAKKINRDTRPIFRKKEVLYEIPWCIAALPNEVWASHIFGSDDAYSKLENVLYQICFIDKDDPILEWEKYRSYVKDKVRILDELCIESLHYTNSLGTDLYIEMPNNCLWSSIGDELEDNMIVNMPSYEIFSSPNYLKTSGIVYNSRPLMYNGALIDDFYIKFLDGKIVDFKASVGHDVLKSIIEGDKNSNYLGEVALVNYDSPISNTNVVFGTTLIDENASCHLALGDGFSHCIVDGEKMSSEELLKHGINQSRNHVDFMIGTSDLRIEAKTNKGNLVIFENGNFNL